jgi:hypothetical protein
MAFLHSPAPCWAELSRTTYRGAGVYVVNKSLRTIYVLTSPVLYQPATWRGRSSSGATSTEVTSTDKAAVGRSF